MRLSQVVCVSKLITKWLSVQFRLSRPRVHPYVRAVVGKIDSKGITSTDTVKILFISPFYHLTVFAQRFENNARTTAMSTDA